MSLRTYVGERLDIMDVYEIQRIDGSIDFMLRIDGGYSPEFAEGMLTFHRAQWRDVVVEEGLVMGVRSFDS